MRKNAQRRGGATEDEIISTVEAGEQFPVKYGRVGFRRNFSFEGIWGGNFFMVKQVEAYAVKEASDWIVVTVTTKYF